MPRRISVYVVDLSTAAKPRPFLSFQWLDPLTGQRRTKSSKLKTRRQAERAAAEFEQQLNATDAPEDGSIAWDQFRDSLTDEVLSGVADKTREKVESVLNGFEKFRAPVELRDVTARYLSQYVAWLREAGRSESTIQSHLRHVKAVFRWAVANKYLPTAPAIPATPRASKRKMMKGRAVTDAEFERFLLAIPGIVGEQHAANWQRMARGLWLSGLRLEESMSLSWDHASPFHVITDDRGRVKLRIPAEGEKGFEDRLYPVTPDFAEFLLTTPVGDRTGFVFQPLYSKGRSIHRYRNGREAGRVFSAVGEATQIIVDAGRPRRDKSPPKPKYASAHDLRRSFGERWSRLVMPPVLQQLMRHATIQTTMVFYVGHDADRTQDEVYRAWESRKSPP